MSDGSFKLDSKALIAGFSSGAVTNLLLHPLDSVKTRLQSQGRTDKFEVFKPKHHGYFAETIVGTKEIIKNEGWRALYQGVGSSVIGASVSWGLYFFIYNSVKSRYEKNGQTPLTRYLILSSVTAGLATCLATHPIWLVKTRMQLQNKKSLEKIVDPLSGRVVVPYKNSLDAVKRIISEEGLSALYIGLIPSLFLISHGVINFVCYDELKSFYLKRRKNKGDNNLNALEGFVIGYLTKLVAVVSTYPLQVVKTRLQDQKNKYHHVRYDGMIDAFFKMKKYEGYRTFFRGIIPHVVRTAPSGAITFMLYEQIMNVLNKIPV
ncbi:folate transporter [Acrasis kona]|uniref:Folate transporter n=1 Tax=Acrasis kona TaxID=1008807 RepID=A0AAW2YL33_9EUKA